MNTEKTLFTQLMNLLPWKSLYRLVDRYDGNYRIRTLPCAEHFRILAFAQLTCRESLRDIEAFLAPRAAKLYRMGFRPPVRRATLADANELRDWRIFADFAQQLIAQARRLYANEDLWSDLSNTDLRRLYSAPSDRAQGIICDQTIALAGFYAQRDYLYYWQVELFFKWIKQHLRIRLEAPRRMRSKPKSGPSCRVPLGNLSGFIGFLRGESDD